jgi:DNA modification methylase
MSLQVEYVSLDSVFPYENNAKIHTDEQIDEIANSIKEFGMIDPIGIWKNNEIIEGHGRLLACKKLGIKEVPIIRLDELTDEQRKAYALAHNKLTMNTDFDFSILNEELASLEDIDMSLFGFEKMEIEEPKQVEEVGFSEDVPSRTKKGDIWILGDHRLMCGDSTNDDDVENLMDGEFADILFTSPPYSDMREYNGDKNLQVNHLSGFIKAYRDYTDYQCVNLGIQRKDHEIVQYWDDYIKEAKNVGYKLMAWNVWDKTMAGSIGQQKAFFPIRHEWIFVFGTEFFEINQTWEKKAENIGKRTNRRKVRQVDGTTKYSTVGDTTNAYKQMESVVSICSETGKIRALHPATFPVGLPAEYIKAMTDVDGMVIEPFGGSGSTLIACEQLQRKCFCMELDPHYCDVIIERWENFTGKKAVLLNESE